MNFGKTPSYYIGRSIEAIDFIEDLDLLRGFCIGNAIKHVVRASRNPGEFEVSDLRKAITYLEHYVSRIVDLTSSEVEGDEEVDG